MGDDMKLSHSTVAATQVADLLGTYYDIGLIDSCRLLKRRFNDTYLVRTSVGDYCCRIGGRIERPAGSIDFELGLLNYLRARRVPVAGPVSLKAGGYWKVLELSEGARQMVLFESAPGRQPDPYSPEDAAAQGRTLALIHDTAMTFTGSTWRAPLDVDLLLVRPMERILQQGFLNAREGAYVRDLARRLREKMDAQAPSLAVGPCHGDCHGWNARILEVDTNPGTERVATFFDFDDCGIGWLAYDIAVFKWSTCVYESHYRSTLWDTFLSSYLSVRQLHENDLALIPYFVAMRHIWLIGEYAFRSYDWGLEWLDREWATRQLNFLSAWDADLTFD